MYDFIGDIHGHADELEALLVHLGYRELHGVYRHPERKVIFLGDFIDRGPRIARVVEIARAMIARGFAMAVMGNHEWNALSYDTANRNHRGTFLRPHTDKNTKQHIATLSQLSPTEKREALEWFRTLPLWLDLDGVRVVHACWDEPSMRRLAEARGGNVEVTDDFLHAANEAASPLLEALETVLKGKEIPLPAGVSFTDKDGHVRKRMRASWYASPVGQSYQSYAMTNEIECDRPLEADVIANASPYPAAAPPVFVGHYWLRAEHPTILASNVACLDYSVAKQGFLCAYRWAGEQLLSNDHFAWIPRK